MAHLYNIQFSSSADLEFNDSQISLIHIDLFHMCLTLFKADYFYYVKRRGPPPLDQPKMVSNDFSRVFDHGYVFFLQNFDFWGLQG